MSAKAVGKPVDSDWRKFLHPFPISDKQFPFAARLHPKANWGIYLAAVHRRQEHQKQG